MDQNALPLRDLHLPDAIGWWPPAPGWWVLFVLALAAGATELALIAPPSSPAFKHALPMFSRYLTEKLEGISTIWPIIAKSYNETGQRFESNRASLIYDNADNPSAGPVLTAPPLEEPPPAP